MMTRRIRFVNRAELPPRPTGSQGEQGLIESAVRLALHQADPLLDLSQVQITIDRAGQGRIGVSGVDELTLARAYRLYQKPV
jgi:hypothetical protein